MQPNRKSDELEARVLERTEQLRQSEERFRLLVDRVQDYAILVLDPSGNISSWNTGAERIFGYTTAEIVGTNFTRFYSDEDLERGRPGMELQTASTHGRVEDEGWRVRKDGSRFWVNTIITTLRDTQGRVVGYTKITRDLTERRAAEQILREQASLLELAHDAILVRDLADRITFWNHGAQEVYGWTREEVIGKVTHELFKTEFPAPLEQITAELFKNDRWEGEIAHLTRSGRRAVMASRWALQRDSYGRATAVLEINRDITERKRAEDALRKQTAELARSNAELQQFAYVASHDLQEPLRMVVSYMQIIAEQYKGRLDADADEFIGYAVEGATRMRQLISALLEYSRAGGETQQAVITDCNRILNDVKSNLEIVIQENAAVITSDPLPTIAVDPTQMSQLFQNLIANAIRFRSKEQPRIHVAAIRNRSEWIFSVADNGIGIAPEHHSRIFVIFQRLHDRMEYPGTGIGLAICKKIVERFGGRIWLESGPGKGSSFFFSIPMFAK
jgi:PAS domain S-box-containing protein